MKLALLSFLGVVLFVSGGQGQKNFVCYFTNWSQYRPGDGKFDESTDLDPHLCTHIVYSFIELTNAPQPVLKLREWNGATLISNIMKLKNANPNLIVTAAVGGWNFGTELFTKVCESEANMARFVSHAVSFLRSYEFDGLDMDWEYPGSRGSPPEDKQQFTILLKKLRKAFDDEVGGNPGKPKLLLTAAVAAGWPTIDAGYEIGPVCEALDLIHLMAYDLHGGWDVITDHNAPLRAPGAIHNGDSDNFSVKYALEYWINGGCPPGKMIMGIPTYGRGFTLLNPSEFGYGASVSGPSEPGAYTREDGILSYYEICLMRKDTDTKVWDDDVAAPAFVTQTSQWIGYDDEESVREKVRFLQSYGLAGAMIWAIDLDDFRGICPGATRTYTLSRAIKEELHSGGSVTTTTSAGNAQTSSSTTTSTATTTTSATTTTAATTTTTGSSSGNVCEINGDGLHPHPDDPNKYYQCSGGTAWIRSCSPGLVFDDSIKTCNYPAA